MPKAEVTVDTYRYHEKSGDPSTPVHEATRGDEIDVSTDELKRGVAAGGLKPKGSTKGATEGWKDVTVDELDAYAAGVGVPDYPTDGKKDAKVKALLDAGVAADTVTEYQPTIS
jgi:hypothetical protein